jgi:hypothetical protein
MEAELGVTYIEASLVVEAALRNLGSGSANDTVKLLSQRDVAHP